MRLEPIRIIRRLIEHSNPHSDQKITLDEVTSMLLPDIQTRLDEQGVNEVSLPAVIGAYNDLVLGEGTQIGNTMGNLRAINAHHLQEGHGGFSEDELLGLTDIAINGSPLGLIGALNPNDRSELPERIYDVLRLEKYRFAANI